MDSLGTDYPLSLFRETFRSIFGTILAVALAV
jgi:hypothetical protein